MTDAPLFRPIRATRVSAQIVAQFRALIADQRLQPGDRLPAERDLARILGVGRSTIREAMRALESLHIVETRGGQGTFLVASDVPLTILPGTALSPGAHAALLEARRLVEPQIAALAAQRATPEELAAARDILASQAAAVAAGGMGTDADAAFHALLCEMARNPVLCQLRESLDDTLRRSREAIHAVPTRPLASLREHEVVLAALEARDAGRAEQAMKAHLQAVSETFAQLQREKPAGPRALAAD